MVMGMKTNLPEHTILSADDFGISPGVNAAVLEAHVKGSLQRASIMANMPHFGEAVQMVRREAQNLQIGLHANLSLGKPLLPADEVSLLVDHQGEFKRDFLGYLLLPWMVDRNQLYRQVENELEQQIKKCLDAGLRLQHLDSHRHVHAIPWIFDILAGLAKKYRIEEIRIINESLISTFFMQPTLGFVFNGNLLKFLVLKTLSAMRGQRSESYTFSILHSCRLELELVEKIRVPKNFRRVEIVLHPGMPALDAKSMDLPQHEHKHLLSENRQRELELALRLNQRSGEE